MGSEMIMLRTIRRLKAHLSQDSKQHSASYLESIRKFTMCDVQALESIHQAAIRITEYNIPGDVVECGVCNGGTAALVASVIKKSGRSIWLYDSFEGMPKTEAIDGAAAKEWVGQCVGSVEKVWEALNMVSFPAKQVIIRKGWFDQTFSLSLPERISLLHIDADWFASVRLSLETFYDRVSDGGLIILDDFGYWEGCREAYYDFCNARQIRPLLERAGRQQAFWIKGQLHNR